MTLDTSALDAKIKEAVKASLANTEALCAAFLQQNPDFPITDIQLYQKMDGTQTTWWIEPRAEDRVIQSENKILKAQIQQLADAIQRGERVLVGGKYYTFTESEEQ